MFDGFIKAAAAAPMIRVADPDYNADRVIEIMKDAQEKGVRVLAFPELTLTGCTCGALFRQRPLLDGAERALQKIVEASRNVDMLLFVGLPLCVGVRVYSVGAAIFDGKVLGFIPRQNVEGTPFSCPDEEDEIRIVDAAGFASVPFGSRLLFRNFWCKELIVGAEIGADMDAMLPSSMDLCLSGASIIVQMAGFPMTVTSRTEETMKAQFRSEHLKAGFLTASPNKGESTTDNVYSGLCLVTENGVVLSESEAEDSYAISEIDVNYLANLRIADRQFDNDEDLFINWGLEETETTLTRYFSKNPHLPPLQKDIPAYCDRLFDIQVSGLVKRMKYAGLDHCVVGISGGVDSTLCVMVCAEAVRRMGLPSTNVIACTMPCFGTTSRTKSNAIIVAEQIGAEVRVIDIGNSVNLHFDDIGHARDDYSIAFENAQARERTQVLMDIANEVNGLDVGTEDLSEYIDGWCTYNGDHTSMYDVNMGVTKTQVRAVVKHIAQNTENKTLADALWDVLDCPVTPELLPVHDDTIEQKSEENVGSYSLQDFFTHKMLICGFTPRKTFRLAKIAYRDEFDDKELLHWLKSYCRRLFSQQFKRSCLMDGPAVENFSVSPRVGFRIPSDGMDTLYLKEVEDLEKELGCNG